MRNEFLRDSTEAKMLARAEGSEREGPSRRALEMEKSQASWPALGPRSTQTSAGRREDVEGSGGSGSGERPSLMGSRGIKRPGFSRIVARLATLLAAEWTTSRTRLWRVTRSPPHPQTRAGSLHLSMTCPQSVCPGIG